MKKLKYILLFFNLINYGQGVKTFFESPEGKFFISAVPSAFPSPNWYTYFNVFNSLSFYF